MLQGPHAMILTYIILILALGAAEGHSSESVSISEYVPVDSKIPVSYLNMCACDGGESKGSFRLSSASRKSSASWEISKLTSARQNITSRIVRPWSPANDGNDFSSVQSPPSSDRSRQGDKVVNRSRTELLVPSDEGIEASAANDTSIPLLDARSVAGSRSDSTGEMQGVPRFHQKRGRRKPKPKPKTNTTSNQPVPASTSQTPSSTDMPLKINPFDNATRQERKCFDAFDNCILGYIQTPTRSGLCVLTLRSNLLVLEQDYNLEVNLWYIRTTKLIPGRPRRYTYDWQRVRGLLNDAGELVAPNFPDTTEKINHYRYGVARLIEPNIIIVFLLMKLRAAVLAEETLKRDIFRDMFRDMNEKVSDFDPLRCENLQSC